MYRTLSTRAFLLAFCMLLPGPAVAGETSAADTVAVELLNPIGRLSSIDNHLFYKGYQGVLSGGSSQSSQGYVLEPVIPFDLPNGKRLAFRFPCP